LNWDEEGLMISVVELMKYINNKMTKVLGKVPASLDDN
jgi:hypothetical protein